MRRSRTSWLGTTALLWTGIFLSGCTSFAVKKPTRFVVLKKGPAKVVFLDARNVVIAVRKWKNKPKGNLEFWAQVIRRDMEKVRGYGFVSEDDVRSRSGLKGREIRFRGAYRGGAYAYRIAIFVKGKYVYTVEMLAPQDQSGNYAEDFQRVVGSLTVRHGLDPKVLE